MSDEGKLASVDKLQLEQDSAHQTREWTDIGTAEVKVDMFGRAKVHVTHQHDHVHSNAKIAAICALFIALALLLYMLSRDHESAATEAQALPEVAAASAVVSSVAPVAVVTTAQPVAKHPNKEQPRVDAVKQSATSAITPAQPVTPKPKPRAVPVINQDVQARSPDLASPVQPSVTPTKAAGDITY